jgi:hypothetical protein
LKKIVFEILNENIDFLNLKKMAIPEGTEIVLEKSFFKFEMKIHF